MADQERRWLGWPGVRTQGTPVHKMPGDEPDRRQWPAGASAGAEGAPPSESETESCPMCGDDVRPAEVRADSGVPWGHHHAHALCALENLAARVAALERVLSQLHPWRDP